MKTRLSALSVAPGPRCGADVTLRMLSSPYKPLAGLLQTPTLEKKKKSLLLLVTFWARPWAAERMPFGIFPWVSMVFLQCFRTPSQSKTGNAVPSTLARPSHFFLKFLNRNF